MSSPIHTDRLDRYLDGMLTGDDLLAFERELKSSPELLKQVELQRNIDGALRGALVYEPRTLNPEHAESPLPDSTTQPALSLPTPSSKPAAFPLRRIAWYAGIAAVLLIGAIIWSTFVHQSHAPAARLIAPATLYADMKSRNFPVQFVCSSDEEFASAVAARFGQGAVLLPTPGVQALGWAYGESMGGRLVGSDTLVLITKVDNEDVLVLMDNQANDRSLNIPATTGLHLFRTTVQGAHGTLVLYEITPLSKARVVDRLAAKD